MEDQIDSYLCRHSEDLSMSKHAVSMVSWKQSQQRKRHRSRTPSPPSRKRRCSSPKLDWDVSPPTDYNSSPSMSPVDTSDDSPTRRTSPFRQLFSLNDGTPISPPRRSRTPPRKSKSRSTSRSRSKSPIRKSQSRSQSREVEFEFLRQAQQ